MHGRSTMHEIWAVVRPAVCVLMFWICNRWWMGNQSQWPCVGPATSLTLGLFTKLGIIQLQQPKWKKQMNCFSHSRLSRFIGIRTKQTMADCPMRILGFEARFFCDVVFIFYAMREIFFFFFLSGMPKISKNNKNSNLKNANFHMRPVTSSALIFVMPAACLCGKIIKKKKKNILA